MLPSVEFQTFIKAMEEKYPVLYWHRQAWEHDDTRPCIRCLQLITGVFDKNEYKRLLNADHPLVEWQRHGMESGI